MELGVPAPASTSAGVLRGAGMPARASFRRTPGFAGFLRTVVSVAVGVGVEEQDADVFGLLVRFEGLDTVDAKFAFAVVGENRP